MENLKCEVCKKEFSEIDLITGHGIHHEIERLIQMDVPQWDDTRKICKDDFNYYRMKYLTGIIEEEQSSIQNLEKAVLDSIRENEIISMNSNDMAKEKMSVGDQLSDNIAIFGGSWKFIISFFAVLFVWILINSHFLLKSPYDPYPFILLNLILSCTAAIQAPIIMMSQNRQEKKDRIRSENDYKVNLKSEIEIRTLHDKVDHLLLDQWSKMMKIQEMQIEILEEIKEKISNKEA